MKFKYSRRNLEGSIGLSGTFGDSWNYEAYYNHGEIRLNQGSTTSGSSRASTNGVDAMLVNGTPTCRINADASTTNNDANCVPINLFGNGSISMQPQPGPLAARRSSTRSSSTPQAPAFRVSPSRPGPARSTSPSAPTCAGKNRSPICRPAVAGQRARHAQLIGDERRLQRQGSLCRIERAAARHHRCRLKLEINGAARYSDYSTSGGIWSWKTGGTLRIANDLLLRAVYSRDIRSPSITEYFLNRSTNIGNVFDPFQGANGTTQNNVVVYGGGNINLTPEISHTLTLGGSYSPSFVRGLRLSVDYYDIDIDNVITTVTANDILQQCFRNAPNDPTCGGTIAREANGTIGSITNGFRNLANYRTRGLDIEASYRTALGNGNLTFRALANHVFNLKINGNDVSGIVGGDTAFSTPKWRGTGTIAFDNDSFGANVRVRYVAGGDYSTLPIINNDVSSRTYVDLGVQFKTGPFTLFGNVNNLFDRDPPITPYTNPNYDVMGRYMSAGVKLNF
jgi:iron complex outermembrane receptor protein